MYIMTHFMKNVLTFLLQYDIYQLLFKVSYKGQKLPFSFEQSMILGRNHEKVSRPPAH